MNYKQQRAIWHKLKEQRPKPPKREAVMTAQVYVRFALTTTPCAGCGWVTKHGRKPIDFWPRDGSWRKLNRLVRTGAEITVIEAYLKECEPLCTACKREQR